jgi:Ca-activated chloride channel family protein
VLFNNRATDLTPGYINATPDMIKLYSDKVAAIQPNSGTNLYQGLANGIQHIDADRTSAIVLVTDGVANVGETHQRQFIELIKQKDIRLFTMIMGNSSNRPMLEAMTRESGGFAISISNSDDIVGQILKASSKVTHEALHGVKVDISGVKTADITPQKIGSLYRGQQLVLLGHYWGDGQATVKINGKISGQPKHYQTQFNFPASTNENPEIERLWAYASIEDMMEEINNFGEKADIKQAIVDLGTEYGLVTDYTSMIVLRDEVFTSRKIERSNRKRLAVEQAAQQQRQARPAPTRRVDQQQPMYKSPRPSFGGGGGAIDPWTLALFGLLAVSLLLIDSRSRKDAA